MAGCGLSDSCVGHRGSAHRFFTSDSDAVRVALDKRDRTRERGNHCLRGAVYIILYVAQEMIYRGMGEISVPS